jgi:glutathione synthase/RimK-type ligase-like ATP-grasp enzyme
MQSKHLRKLLRRYPFFWKTNQLLSAMMNRFDEFTIIDDRDALNTADKVIINWPSNLKKPHIGIIKDYGNYPYWTKYERFLINNNFTFDYYEIHKSQWVKDAEEFDLIIGVPDRHFSSLEEMRMKFATLELCFKKKTYPSVKELTIHENKMLQYELLVKGGYPVVSTFVSFDYDESIEFLRTHEGPFVSKLIYCSGSVGVELVKTNRSAQKITRNAFSRMGRNTYYPDNPQKGYVYFQEYIIGAEYDLRVIVTGNLITGYFRYSPKGDFRASGSGIEVYSDIPMEARNIAVEVANYFDFPSLAVDFVFANNRFQIIELSSFTEVDIRESLIVQNIEGIYRYYGTNNYEFVPAKVWINELALREFLTRCYS